MNYFERQRDRFAITTDPAKLDHGVIYDYLHNHAYWSQGRTRETIEKSKWMEISQA